MATSPEYQTFKQHYDELKIGLDPSSVVDKAFARDLLSREERNAASHTHYTDDEKLDKFLGALDRRIAVDKAAFHTFMEVLEAESAFQHLTDKLKGEFIPSAVHLHKANRSVSCTRYKTVLTQHLLQVLLSSFCNERVRAVEKISFKH